MNPRLFARRADRYRPGSQPGDARRLGTGAASGNQCRHRARRLPSGAEGECVAGLEHFVTPFPSNHVPQGFIIFNAQQVIPQLAVNYLLLDFGGRAAAVEAAGQLSIAGNVAFTAAHQQLIFNVARAYFTLDGADAAVRAARQGLADAQVVQQSAEALFLGLRSFC